LQEDLVVSELVLIWTFWLVLIISFLMMLSQLWLDKNEFQATAKNSVAAEEEVG